MINTLPTNPHTIFFRDVSFCVDYRAEDDQPEALVVEFANHSKTVELTDGSSAWVRVTAMYLPVNGKWCWTYDAEFEGSDGNWLPLEPDRITLIARLVDWLERTSMSGIRSAYVKQWVNRHILAMRALDRKAAVLAEERERLVQSLITLQQTYNMRDCEAGLLRRLLEP